LPAIELTYLSGADVAALALTDDEILGAVRGVLAAQGRGETVIEPRTHLFPGRSGGHFNVPRGVCADHAGVRVVGDFVDNHRLGLPSELALLLLLDPVTGVPLAVVDATAITEMRTAAVTAVSAEHLARGDARTLGHIGAPGTAYWNICLLSRVLPELEEVRVHSRRVEAASSSRAVSPASSTSRSVLSLPGSSVRRADVVVEASRLSAPEPLLASSWIKPGALVIPYGTVSAIDLDLTEIMDKIVVDDWGQAHAGPLGSLRAHVDSGRLSERNLHAELGQIVCGLRPGRERPDETILFWHRGLSITDIALGETLLAKARELGIGARLPYR